MTARPACVLVGPPGSGKSTVGALLAQALAVPTRDTDTDVEATAGKTISDIFVEDGEPRFRELERAAVGEALTTFDGVLSLGGGAVCDPDTRAALRGHTVVYLAVGLSQAVARIGLDRSRPLLAVNPRATLRHLLEQRRPLYEAVATMTVETDDRSAEEVAAQVLAELRAT